MAASPSHGEVRPSVQGFRRSSSQFATVPTRSLSFHEQAGLDKSDASAEVLYSHPGVRIYKFAPPIESVKSSSTAKLPHDTDYPVDTVETLPWRSRTETLLATGPMFIEKVRGSTQFLKCVDMMHALLRNSQCWCVDGESKFVMRVGPFRYYRIELPSTTDEDKQKVEELKTAFGKVLRYERSPCPFIRAFQVDLPDDAITPRRKGTWKRRESSTATTPETETPPLRRIKTPRTWSLRGPPPTSFPSRFEQSPHERPRTATTPVVGSKVDWDTIESKSPANYASSEDGTDSDRHDAESDAQTEDQDSDFNSEKEDVSVSSEKNVQPEVVPASSHELLEVKTPVVENRFPKDEEADTVEQTPRPHKSEILDHTAGVTGESDSQQVAPLLTDSVENADSTPSNSALDTSQPIDSTEPVEHDNLGKDVDDLDANESLADIAGQSSEIPQTAGILAETNETTELPASTPDNVELQNSSSHYTDSTQRHDNTFAAERHETLMVTNSDVAEEAEGIRDSNLDMRASTPASDVAAIATSDKVPIDDQEHSELAKVDSEVPVKLVKEASNDENDDDDAASTISGDSFYTITSDNQLDSGVPDSADSFEYTPQRIPLHRRELSELTVTDSRLEERNLNTAARDGIEAPPLLGSSASDSSWPGIQTPSAPIHEFELRQRLKHRRSLSPMPPVSTMAVSANGDHHRELSKVILQKAATLAVVKPIEVVVLVFHILARIAGGATVNDLMSGELFRRPGTRRTASGSFEKAHAAPRRETDTDEEDDYGVPLSGRRRSSVRDSNMSATWKDDHDDAASFASLD